MPNLKPTKIPKDVLEELRRDASQEMVVGTSSGDSDENSVIVAYVREVATQEDTGTPAGESSSVR